VTSPRRSPPPTKPSPSWNDASDPQVHTDLQNYRDHRDGILANIHPISPTQ
jgi:hypothetical protein